MAEDPNKFKSQPWMLFDTVVAKSFLLGDGTADGLAVGTQSPAISAAGEMTFLATGRNMATYPWYTNMQQDGAMSYGMEVWQIALEVLFPTLTPNQNNGFDLTIQGGVPPNVKLAECLLNYSVLQLELGQENQMSWPVTKFGPGGGMAMSDNASSVNVSSGERSIANVLKLAEPIEMPRTQNISAKLRIAPEVHQMIGTVAAPGVGRVLAEYDYAWGVAPNNTDVAQPPWAVRLTLSGRRIKHTQYGQIPG